MAEMEKEIKVVFENKAMVVVDKPSGYVTTKDAQKNVYEWLRINYPNNLPRNGIAHRLDKGTSGLLIIAKTSDGLEKIQGQFKKRTMVKKYYALVSGIFPFEAEVNMPIGRSRFKFDCFAVMEDGKNARTIFKRLKTIKLNNKFYSLIESDLKTGRTHQIRVHLKYLKYPIVGDKLYGGEEGVGDRIWLQAYYLEIDGLKIEIPLDPELGTIINNAVEV